MVSTKYPTTEELERLISATFSVSERVANLKPFYIAIGERDEELSRRAGDIRRLEGRVEREKQLRLEAERKLRSQPRTPEQLRALVAKLERQHAVLATALERAQTLLASGKSIQDEAENLTAEIEELLTEPS